MLISPQKILGHPIYSLTMHLRNIFSVLQYQMHLQDKEIESRKNIGIHSPKTVEKLPNCTQGAASFGTAYGSSGINLHFRISKFWM